MNITNESFASSVRGFFATADICGSVASVFYKGAWVFLAIHGSVIQSASHSDRVISQIIVEDSIDEALFELFESMDDMSLYGVVEEDSMELSEV